MVAFVPARRRSARSALKRWSLIAVSVATLVVVSVASAIAAYSLRPATEVAVSQPLVQPTATVVPYVPPAGPDLSLPAAYSKPLEVALPPRTADAVQLHVGPSALYAVIGTLQSGATLEIVGRDETGEWLAIVFPPNSTLRGWLPVSQTLYVQDVDALPVESVTWLP